MADGNDDQGGGDKVVPLKGLKGRKPKTEPRKKGTADPEIAGRTKSKRGDRITNEQIAEGLTRAGGMVELAARQLGIAPNTIRARVRKSAALRAVLESEREVLLDIAENSLRKAAIAGEPWAVTLILKMKGRDRGYVERREYTGPNGEDIPVALDVSGLVQAAKENRAMRLGLQKLKDGTNPPALPSPEE